ncbi:MAG: DUF2852 domain-containing protein [Hyphomicrobiales bacterium]
MELTSKLDEYGWPAWIGVMVLGFVVFWPIGLAVLAYMLWSGRMGCWKSKRAGRWHNKDANRDRSAPRWGGAQWNHASSGNRAFDEYREDTLRRLEDEQREFTDFLERLRHARDKAEFDQFMAERRNRAEDADEDNTPTVPDTPGGKENRPQA